MGILGIAALTLVAAIVGTVSGFGMSTIMIPVLVLFLPPAQAIFLVAIIHWFGDAWKIGLFREGVNLRLIGLFGLTGLAASYFGATISLGANETILLRLLGAFLVGYAIFLLLQSRFKVPASGFTALIGGALSGFFAGLFGIGGAIRSLFLTAFDLPKAVYIATIGAIGIMVDSSRIITYVVGGETLPARWLCSLAIFIPASFAGAEIGKRLVDRIPQTAFRGVVAVFVLAAGLKLLLSS